MTSQPSSYDIKNGLNILLSLPDNLKKPELEFIMRELNILRKMRHVNSLMVVNNTSSTDSTNLYNDVNRLSDLDKENIHNSLLDIKNIQSNNTIFSNLLVICEYDKKYDMINNLNKHNLTDYLLITYKLNTTDSDKKVYNLLRVLAGLQTCFREPTNVYNTYGLYSLDNRNILSVMLPNNDNNLLSNTNGRDEILYLENIIDNSSKTGYFKSMTVGVSDEKTRQTGGRLRSTLKKLFRRNKKQTKQKKIKISDIQRTNGADYPFMKANYNGRTVYDTTKNQTESGKYPMRNSIVAKSADYKKVKKFNNIDNDNIKLLIKKIDLTASVNSIPDKVKTLEAKYDIVFNYSNMNKLKLLDFVLFTDVGEPSLLNIRRYKLSDPNSEPVLSGKLNKKGKDAYKKAKSERLTKRHAKIDKTKEKLTKKKKEVRKQSKLNYKLQSDKEYRDLLAELDTLTGFRNILARRRVKAKLNKRKAEILKNLSDKERKNLNNNSVSAKEEIITAKDRLKNFRNFKVFKRIYNIQDNKVESILSGTKDEMKTKYETICNIFEAYLDAVEINKVEDFFAMDENFKDLYKLYTDFSTVTSDLKEFDPKLTSPIINDNSNYNDKKIIKNFFNKLKQIQEKISNVKPRFKNFRDFDVFKRLYDINDGKVISKLRGTYDEIKKKYNAICSIFKNFLNAAEQGKEDQFFKNDNNFKDLLKLYKNKKDIRFDMIAYQSDRAIIEINNNNKIITDSNITQYDKTFIKYFFIELQKIFNKKMTNI
jgi:hypothetical protein